ncbi:MAG: LysR family transcriptional regulator [Asticcacaulis sp.]
MTAMPNAFKIYIRLLHDCDIALGPGKADLLETIDREGSLSAAAKTMDISYRRVWAMVESMNNGFKEPLVATAHGGAKGGGATVTPLGHEVLKRYRSLQSEVNDLTLRHFEHIKPLMKAD